MLVINVHYLKVAFTQYFNDFGKNVKVGSRITGELIRYSNMRTEYGDEIVGIVVGNDSEIYYVPAIWLFQLE